MTSSTWIFGSSPSCDVWIRSPEVAFVHCQLKRQPSGYQLEDLGSSTGTTINQIAVAQPTECSPSDAVYLAGAIEMPWPEPRLAKVVVRLGYAPQSEYPIPNDDAISRNHALLILDPHDQVMLIDSNSTNGTWVDDNRIKSTVLEPHEPFRLGVTELTAAAVFSRTGHHHLLPLPLTPSDADASTSNQSDWWYAGILTATLIVAGIAAYFVLAKATTADNSKIQTVVTETIQALAVKDVVPQTENTSADEAESTDANHSTKSKTRPALGELTTSDIPFTEAKPTTPAILTATSDAPDSSDSIALQADAKLSSGSDVQKSVHLIIIEGDGHQFDFAVAWEAAPHVLVTNAHVVQSLKKNQFEFSLVRVFDHWQRQVVGSGVCESYLKFIAEIEALEEQTASVREQVQKLSQEDTATTGVQTLVEKWRELSRDKQWLQRKADCFDVGWIEVKPASAGKVVHLPKYGKTPVQDGKRLKIYHPSIENESAYYLVDEARELNSVAFEVNKMLITDDPSAPLSWLATFDKKPDDWKYFLFDGCPIVDLRGRIAGMYVGKDRQLSKNPTDEPNTSFHFTSRNAIQQAIEQAESQNRHPTIR